MRRASDVALEVKFDPNSVVDMAEKDLIGTTLRLDSAIFGFPDFKSLLELRGDGSVYFFGGMVSKEPGLWCVVEGDQSQGERPSDLYLEFTQPLTDFYKEYFLVPGGNCLWRGKLLLPQKKDDEVRIVGGVVVSEPPQREGVEGLFQSKQEFVREGVFTASSVDESAAFEVQTRNADAFERALTTPKAESSGFKTPAALAGIRKPFKPQRLLGRGRKDEDKYLLEDD